MKPQRVPTSNLTLKLPRGNEDNDLWAERTEVDGRPVTISVWDLAPHERAAIMAGATIELVVWGVRHPPVSLGIGETLEGRRDGGGA